LSIRVEFILPQDSRIDADGGVRTVDVPACPRVGESVAFDKDGPVFDVRAVIHLPDDKRHDVQVRLS
jgi:hypothetical protein